MAMNIYKNCLEKLRVLLVTDTTTSAEDCKVIQWQLLYQHPKFPDWKFVLGKGGVNTIFFSSSNATRKVCYPDEAKEMLQSLSKRDAMCYSAFDGNGDTLGIFLFEDDAKSCKGARKVKRVAHNGKTKTLWKKEKDLFGKRDWVSTE